jgi:hypothetical protein
MTDWQLKIERDRQYIITKVKDLTEAALNTRNLVSPWNDGLLMPTQDPTVNYLITFIGERSISPALQLPHYSADHTGCSVHTFDFYNSDEPYSPPPYVATNCFRVSSA